MARLGIVGSATWGTTLGIMLASKGLEVSLWCRTEREAEQMRGLGENRRFLRGMSFPPSLRVTSSEEEALHGATMVIFAVPSRSLRENVQRVRDALVDSSPSVIVSACKGLEITSGKRMSQVLMEDLPSNLHSRICALSGPNLAHEIVKGKPSSTVVASNSREAALMAQDLLMSPTFRVYTNDDVIGVELSGALKNIIALGAGISDGLGYGDNAKAAFITRGLAEITRLGVAAGASPMTFAGLAGMGDLIATCSSPLSRNHYVGTELAKGRALDEILLSMGRVAEGVDTTVAALSMAKALGGVEMPIAQVTYRVLFEGLDPRQAVAELMGRSPKREWAGLGNEQG